MEKLNALDKTEIAEKIEGKGASGGDGPPKYAVVDFGQSDEEGNVVFGKGKGEGTEVQGRRVDGDTDPRTPPRVEEPVDISDDDGPPVLKRRRGMETARTVEDHRDLFPTRHEFFKKFRCMLEGFQVCAESKGRRLCAFRDAMLEHETLGDDTGIFFANLCIKMTQINMILTKIEKDLVDTNRFNL